MGIETYGITDLGQKREVNQDQFLIAEMGRALVVHRSSLELEDQSELKGPAFAQLFAVADGVGGTEGGETASLLAVRSIVHYTLSMLPWCVQVDPKHDDDLVDELRSAIERCQTRMEVVARREPNMARMATTLTMGFVVWPRAWILHVGDSRCYHLRDGALKQVTADHTIARELVAHGAMTESGIQRSSWKNVLSNAITPSGSETDPSVHRLDLELGDALLFCTDGVTKHVPEEAIASVMASAASAEDACQQLVDRANADGGSDNITCVVARFCDASLAKAETVRIAK